LLGHGIEARVTPGDQSQFDVVVDDEVVFAKQQIGRFPEPGEIGTRLTAR